MFADTESEYGMGGDISMGVTHYIHTHTHTQNNKQTIN